MNTIDLKPSMFNPANQPRATMRRDGIGLNRPLLEAWGTPEKTAVSYNGNNSTLTLRATQEHDAFTVRINKTGSGLIPLGAAFKALGFTITQTGTAPLEITPEGDLVIDVSQWRTPEE